MSEPPEQIPAYAVSSDLIGGKEALRLFQEATQEVFNTRPDEARRMAEFEMRLRAAHLGGLLLTEVDSSGQRFERPRSMVAATGIDHFLVQLYTAGGYSGLVDGRDIRVRAGDICILDLARTLETRAADFRNITLVIPRPTLEAAMADVDALHGLVLPREEPITGIIAAHLEMLTTSIAALAPADAEAVSRATVSLIARLVEGRTGTERGQAARAAAAPLRRIMRYIDANLHDPELSPALLTERFGLSRATLYRMFEPLGGVAELIRSRRLRGAAIELASETGQGRRISEVATAWGFSDDGSFSRAFRAEFDISPSEARERASEIWAKARPGSLEGLEGAELAYWLRTLHL